MNRVDSENWVAIYVEQVSPTGTITFTDIHVQGGSYYTTIPVTLPLGLNVQGAFRIKNTCSVALIMQAKSWFLNPAGQMRGYSETGMLDPIYLPGESAPAGTDFALLDLPGTWRLVVELWAEVA